MTIVAIGCFWAAVGVIAMLMHPDILNLLIGLVILTCLAGIYFYPSIVATKRKVRNPEAVILVNVLLGWTVIGWLAAIVMATTMQTIFAAALEQEAFGKMNEQPNPPSSN